MTEDKKPNKRIKTQASEPTVLAFLCNWCAYAGVDSDWISKFQYPPNIKTVRVMCSGRVDPVFILEGFLAGFDGIMVFGCPPGDCHYLNGNIEAEKKINVTRRLLKIAEFDNERLYLDRGSAGERQRFSEVITQFVTKVRERGPLELDEFVKRKLQAVKGVLEGEKFRWLVGKSKVLVEEGNVYGEKVSQEIMDELLDEISHSEYLKNRIFLVLKEKPLTTEEISRSLGMELNDT
ncbi:MAG: hydrogenase iron-sulfur subunit, partial [Proteobacteria bacterium]|nr:hydrogenase iron-sulfur subunit [Pseudomonadota bacterium]